MGKKLSRIVFFLSAVFIFLFIYVYDIETRDGSPYLSYTAVEQLSNGIGREAVICEFDLQDQVKTEIFRFPINAMYALGVYDRTSHSVFYVKESENNTFERKYTGDQIYMYNLDSGSNQKLTEDLLAVNYILPADNFVFFLAATLENPNSLVVGRIDLSNGDIRYWNETSSASSRLLSIDREQERLYVAIYDTKDEDAALSTNYGVVPTHTIYSYNYDLNDKQEILQKENMRIRALYVRDNFMIYTAQNGLTLLESSYAITHAIDLDSMKITLETDDILSQEGCFSADLAGVYAFSQIGDFNGISYFDLSTQEYTPILMEENKEIVNFQLLT